MNRDNRPGRLYKRWGFAYTTVRETQTPVPLLFIY